MFFETKINTLIKVIDNTLRTLHTVGTVDNHYPPNQILDHQDIQDAQQRKHSAGLMRVNHVGEVCAQSLYLGQSLTAKTDAIKQFNQQAAYEETQHLLWTAQRLKELNSRPSLLNPLWYSGAFGLGLVAGALGDRISLGFVKETESQVAAHLNLHETLLPIEDVRSRTIVAHMKIDEIQHGQQAQALGAINLPFPIRCLMKATAKLMTTTAYYI